MSLIGLIIGFVIASTYINSGGDLIIGALAMTGAWAIGLLVDFLVQR